MSLSGYAVNMGLKEEAAVSQREWVRNWLAAHGLAAQKALGQHFLVDRGLIARIVDAVAGGGVGAVMEIGPGLGALTGPLLARGLSVLAVELDRAYVAYLRETWGAARLTVLEADARRLLWGRAWAEHGGEGPLVVAGNLPYYLSGPLVARLWEDDVLPWTRAVFMLQREAALRLVAEPGEAGAGAPSVMLHTVGRPRLLFDVAPEAFFPMPEVTSTVIEVVRVTDGLPHEDRLRLRRLVAAGFGQRRKTLKRAMAALGADDEWIRAAGVDSRRRAETLTMDEWVRMAWAHRAIDDGTRDGG
jgi:16S rRNA (adenine1518-N6/adenine1519-N6)-dimethyltransferase